MGYLTTITIHNDALHEFEAHPELFAKAIFDGIREANRNHVAADESFSPPNGGSYGGYITVEPSRHADDATVYVHTGNTVFNLNSYNEDFKRLLARNPKVAESFVKTADSILKESKRKLKEAKASTIPAKKALSHKEEFGSGA